MSENASERKSFAGIVYKTGEKAIKACIINTIPHANLHLDADIYIHDLDAYGVTYNCLAPNIHFESTEGLFSVVKFLNYCKDIIMNLGHIQAGGIAFINFDTELGEVLRKNDVNITKDNGFIQKCISDFLVWLDVNRSRCGLYSYYVTLNLGLDTSTYGRYVTEITLNSFLSYGASVIKPNIVFKIKKGINSLSTDPNYDLLQLSIKCTITKMIPTYLLCDSVANNPYEPQNLAIMGCRTRVVENIFGDGSSRGRGNISNITINLPKIASKIDKELPLSQKIDQCMNIWSDIAKKVVAILLHRYEQLISTQKESFTYLKENLLWKDSSQGIEQQFNNGTHSIGFIGLDDMFSQLTTQPYKNLQLEAVRFVKHMRDFTDKTTKEFNLNFSLLATSGEFISGYFFQKDIVNNGENSGKGHYTNSFHINVNAEVTPFQKINFEAPFHELCNGGCITYIELKSAPTGNIEALHELIMYAEKKNINYLGFNFPLDRCLDCENIGTFDTCSCGSNNIKRIRRVSGYLEDLNYFTTGKKNEEFFRRSNA